MPFPSFLLCISSALSCYSPHPQNIQHNSFCMKDVDFDDLLTDLGVLVVPDESSDERDTDEFIIEGVKEVGEGAEASEAGESHFVHEEVNIEEARALSKEREATLEKER